MMKMFTLVHVGERAGSGIPNMVRNWTNAGYEKPVLTEQVNPERSLISLPLSQVSAAKRRQKEAVEKAVGKGGRNEYGTSQERKEAILEYLSAGSARSADIAQAIGLGTTRTNDLLREMIHEKKIVVSGKTRAREYEKPVLTEQVNPERSLISLPLSQVSAAKRRQKEAVEKAAGKGGRNEYGTSQERKEAILEYLSAGSARSADIAQAIGLGTTRTNDLLREMILEKKIVVSGKTRARKYCSAKPQGG